MKQAKILVFSAGFGNGHLRAAEAVIEGIRQKRPQAKIMHLDFGDFLSRRFNNIAKNLYLEMIKHTPMLWGKFYYKTAKLHPNSKIQRFLKQMGRREFLDYIQSYGPDFIVCTYPTVSSILAQLRLEQVLQVPVVTVITDYTVHSHWVHPGVDQYIVACDEVKEDLVSWGINEQCILVTGIPVSPRFEIEIDRQDIVQKMGLDPDLPTILVMGGAYGGGKSVTTICKTLGESLLPVQTIVVCGKNRKLFLSLGTIIEQARNPISRLEFVKNVEELMSVSDLIITKAGGLTVSEALTKGLPLVIYKAIPGQEEANACFVQRSGAGHVAKTEKDVCLLIERFLNNPAEIENMRKNAASALSGHSAERAVEAMFQTVLNLKGIGQKTG